jgi:tryptophan synthase alpha chain
MSRIANRFSELRAEGRTALIPYVTAGDPEPGITVALMHAMVQAGADIIELGVPFSDPMADGPVIQHAAERALRFHVSLRQVLDMVREFRQSDDHTPVVLMGYLNPVEVMGYEAFATAAAEAGVDGVLTVDMPPEEAEEFLAMLRPRGVDAIFLLAPTTDPERMARVCEAAGGFVYYVSVKGVTGAAHLDTADVAARLEEVRKHTALPIGVGFGIRDPESAARLATVADAVIVGSALVSRIGALDGEAERVPETAAAFLNELRRAMDAATAAHNQ